MMICDERQEFELNLGKAVDTLKHDYPDILTEPPGTYPLLRRTRSFLCSVLTQDSRTFCHSLTLFTDYSVYDPNLEVVDPAGVKVHGLPNYRNAFRLVHTVVNLFYCPERSLLTFRLVYDWARNEIRVSWNAEVVPKQIFGGVKTTLHVDGISVYVLDKKSGKIVQHRVEHLTINDVHIKPERGIIHALKKEVIEPNGIPVCYMENDDGRFPEQHVVQFQQTPLSLFSRTPSTSLFSVSNDVDWDAFERKNASRKKFGLDPLTPEEFQDIQAQVEQMDIHQRTRASTTTTTTPPTKKEKGGFLGKLFSDILQDTCESNFDCTRPEVCCDFGFTKKCCTSGMLVGDHPHVREQQPALVPVVAGYPPGMGPDSEPRTF